MKNFFPISCDIYCISSDHKYHGLGVDVDDDDTNDHKKDQGHDAADGVVVEDE